MYRVTPPFLAAFKGVLILDRALPKLFDGAQPGAQKRGEQEPERPGMPSLLFRASGFPPRQLERLNVIPTMAPVFPALARWLPKASLWDQI